MKTLRDYINLIEANLHSVTEGLADTQKKIEDTILKLEQRLKFAKTPEQWDNIKNRIERLQAGLTRSKTGVAEGSDELYQKAIRKYAQRVANDYLGGGNEYLYGANKFDSEMFGVDPKQAQQDFKTLFAQLTKQQGVADNDK